MSETGKRIVAGLVMVLIAGLAALGQYLGLPAVRYLATAVSVAMVVEMALAISRNRAKLPGNRLVFGGFTAWLCLVAIATWRVSARPWIVLLLLLIICSADIGAWFFGKWLGGDKMWERLSGHKTWTGQIAGIICGTVAGVLYGLLGADAFMPQLMWIGISVALLSQYGDLTASWVKRRMGIKDFGNEIPGHGGLLDRFDGWIYVMPIIWLVL